MNRCSRRLADLTAVGRPLDLAYPSNRYVVAASVVGFGAGLVVGLIGGDALGDALGLGVRTGVAAFLAWAAGREVDPDDARTAAVAAPIGAVAVALGPPMLAAVFAVLLVKRIVGRTTGLPLRPLDAVLVLGLAAWLGAAPYGLVAVLSLAAAAALDVRLERPAAVWHRALPLGVLIAGSGVMLAAGSWPERTSVGVGTTVLVAAAAAGAVVLHGRAATTTGDHTAEPLDARRIRIARLLALTMAAGYAVAGGGVGIAGMGPVWAGFAGATIPALARPLSRRARSGGAAAP